MYKGFFRAAACAPAVNVADVEANVNHILQLMAKAVGEGAELAVFPEMCVTAYTCADLFHNSTLLSAAMRGLWRIVDECPADLPMAIVGCPVTVGGELFNCAVALSRGRIHGIVPKTYLPGYNEFYEKRWFAPARAGRHTTAVIDGHEVPFGTDLIFDVAGVRVGIEICEDLWAPVPPSCATSLAGAQIIANISASDDVIGKYGYLMDLISQQSARCLCGYVYASAGYGESSTDLVFDAKTVIAECGRTLARGDRWQRGDRMVMADIDIEAIDRDRMHITTFGDCAARTGATARTIAVAGTSAPSADRSLLRGVDPHPFVPSDNLHLTERCEEIIHIQTAGLCRRLDATRCRSLTIGISGGLDSTLALLIAVRAFDSLGIDRSGIIGVTMPGFGTTDRTYTNAIDLMHALGVTVREISIAAAVTQHFSDIGHDAALHDVTYENSQARERTQILMDIANQTGGMVLGTGDLSELALGWATYNGDHMSMYGVNAGVPKTLVRHLVRYFATSDPACADARTALLDIVDTPISPELIPADADGNITQKTEDLVGPYELHDFFLYYMLRYGFSPSRIYLLARTAFADVYDDDTIRHWLRTFMRRFFAQQFKRSCLPDDPKVGSVTLSPRGDWRMPSDASAALWLAECDRL
ncbi:MAG: NAD(+) synthase [Bacteroidales bacterium]|nr:NAD(+) synthase [Bacteroidales bacterium]